MLNLIAEIRHYRNDRYYHCYTGHGTLDNALFITHIILSPNSNTKAKHGVTFFVSQAILTAVLKAPLHAYVIMLMSQKLSNMTTD